MRSVALPTGVAKGGSRTVYRDSQYGLTIDLTGPDGNFFHLLTHAQNLDKQLEREHRFKPHLDMVRAYCDSIGKRDYHAYDVAVQLFEYYYPFIHLIKVEEE
jgi:hypothetical protein